MRRTRPRRCQQQLALHLFLRRTATKQKVADINLKFSYFFFWRQSVLVLEEERNLISLPTLIFEFKAWNRKCEVITNAIHKKVGIDNSYVVREVSNSLG